jgi:glycine betaine/proline transport system substrate-binding protein
VPQYVADAGVKSLADLAANKDKFAGKMFGIESGNDGNRIMQSFIDDTKNNLGGWTVVESSEAGMLTEAEKAIKNNEWIVFLGWTPHPVMGDMKLHYLSGVESAGFGSATVYTNTRAGWATECPNAAKLVSNMKFTLPMVGGSIMAPVLKDGKDPKAVAADWVKSNADTVSAWLEGVTTIDGGDAKAAVMK